MDAHQQEDLFLIEAARTLLAKRFKQNRHEIGAALRTRSGEIFAAVHLEAHVGRAAVCAETIALGMAAASGEIDIEAIVAVDGAGQVVSPCGICRELISDYAPHCRVIIAPDRAVLVLELLPEKYRMR